MNIQTISFRYPSVSALLMAAVLSFPCVTSAVSIGEIILQSKLGQPLLAQVDLIVGEDENIDDSCLSLAAADPIDQDPSGYLTKANLSIKSDGKRQYVVISSPQSLNDPFARLRLQIKCPDTGRVIKTLTVLPDMDTSVVAQADIVAPRISVEAENSFSHLPAPTHDVAPATKLRYSLSAQPGINKHPARKTTRTTHTQPPEENTDSGHKAAFRLKLSGDPIDESRIGKISSGERAMLLARQKLLDADDQMASFLAMQNQVKQLQDELGDIKSQLAQLGVTPTNRTSPESSPNASPVTSTTSGTAENIPKPIAIKQPVSQANNPDLQNGLLIGLGIVLAIIALWFRLRSHTKPKSRTGSQQIEPVLIKSGDGVASAKVVSSANLNPSAPAPASKIKSDPAPAIASSKTGSTQNEPITSAPAQPKNSEEVTEEDSMLEEAGLYASHGRPAKAIEILQEIIKRRPSKAEAWPLLLSIYSSLAKAAEFERTAREFLKHHKDSPAWGGIQALGRTFDQNNPLYTDNNNPISSGPLLADAGKPRRPVGDVLIEMGVLSKQYLQNCLDDFDPKKHGRFGGYLVARKAITLAQLDQALLQQQGVNNEEKAGSLPSLQDMENFLADFDPKLHGSVGEYLASRDAATPEKLTVLLQQQYGFGGGAKMPTTNERPSSEKASTAGFFLDSPQSPDKSGMVLEQATTKRKPFEVD